MFKKLTIVWAVTCLMLLFSLSGVMAADPQWREHQKALFDEIGISPGDVIGKGNCQKVDGFVPDSIFAWVKKGIIEMRIEEMMYDMNSDDEWEDYGPKHNVGKYAINENDNLVDAKTGEPPLFVYGNPFPNIDMENDPQSGAKFLYNRFNSNHRFGSERKPFSLEWISVESGYERHINAHYDHIVWWARPNREQIPNPAKHRWREVTLVTKPFDLKGTAQLSLQRLDGKPDDVYVYVPAIRRVKKMSGSNRSDPYLGSDFAVDDGKGWNGQNASMKWRFIKETTGLCCLTEYFHKQPDVMKKRDDGSWISASGIGRTRLGWEEKGWPRATFEIVNGVWVPRKFYVIEAIPKDSYYNYGKIIYWFDRDTCWPQYKIIFDRASEYWKTTFNLPGIVEWDNGKKGTQYFTLMLGYDEKTSHASATVATGNPHGEEVPTIFYPTYITPKLLTPERLSTLSK